MRMKLRETVADLARQMDLPPDALGSGLRVTVSGRRQVTVEHHRGLLGYGREEIHVNGGSMKLRVLGRELEVRAMDRETLVITGHITAVEYE